MIEWQQPDGLILAQNDQMRDLHRLVLFHLLISSWVDFIEQQGLYLIAQVGELDQLEPELIRFIYVD